MLYRQKGENCNLLKKIYKIYFKYISHHYYLIANVYFVLYLSFLFTDGNHNFFFYLCTYKIKETIMATTQCAIFIAKIMCRLGKNLIPEIVIKCVI